MTMINTSYTTATERRIARDIIAKALLAGCAISVYDGEAYAIRRSTKQGEIEAALASTEFDVLDVYKDGKRMGAIALCWGNDEDLVSDCTDTPFITSLI